MNLLSNLLAFVFALGVIIFVHELGHLLVAKAFKVRAKVFSLGFGRRLWGFEHGGTDYRIALVPLGGYVQLGGEEPGEVTDDPHEFLNRPRWQRVLVYAAGPAMNVVLAILLVAGVYMVGVEVPAPPNLPAVIGTVLPGMPGEAAGLAPGDRIIEVAGRQVSDWDEVRFEIITAPGRELSLRYRRGEEVHATVLVPEKIERYEMGDAGIFPEMLPRIAGLVAGDPAAAAGLEIGDEVRKVDGRSIGGRLDFVSYLAERAGQPIEIEVLRRGASTVITVVPREREGRGWIGVQLAAGAFQRFGPVEALVESVRFNADITVQTFVVLGRIFTGRMAAKTALAGPIEIAAMSGAAVRSGFVNLLHLMGLISISIAILNLLPVPVLDGGQILILVIESLRRRDLSLKVKERINQVGFVMIVMLMVAVLYFDLVKNLPEGFLPGS
jgi:regulator of sigma E protease